MGPDVGNREIVGRGKETGEGLRKICWRRGGGEGGRLAAKGGEKEKE